MQFEFIWPLGPTSFLYSVPELVKQMTGQRTCHISGAIFVSNEGILSCVLGTEKPSQVLRLSRDILDTSRKVERTKFHAYFIRLRAFNLLYAEMWRPVFLPLHIQWKYEKPLLNLTETLETVG